MIRTLFIIGFVLLISLSAQLTFNLNLPQLSIPVTGQTLAILTGALFLYPRESFFGLLGYCLLGILGLPIFSDGNSGWEAFSGNSLGYFVGFIVAAVGSSYAATKAKHLSMLWTALIMLIGTLIILLFGTLFLSFRIGIQAGIENGFIPFLSGGVVKILIGILLVFLIRRFDLLPAVYNSSENKLK